MKQPKKAVIAAAGFGTRFLPQTKAQPKEMLPLIDKPIIQYVVEELVASGIRDIIIVGSANKRAIEDHFDLPSEELLVNLRAGGPKKAHFIEEIEAIAELANFAFVRQKGPYGSATPLACAAHLIDDDEPFIYTFADDFFVASPSRTQQMIDTYQTYGGSVLACKRIVDDKEYDKYGIAAGQRIDDVTISVSHIDEKPGKDKAQSNLASVSGYLLEPNILSYIRTASQQYDGTEEFMIQPIMQQMINDGYKFQAREVQSGIYYDTGDKLEYLKTIIDFGLQHPELGPSLARHLNKRV